MANRVLKPATPILNQTVSAPVNSSILKLEGMAGAQVAMLVKVGAGLTATFNLTLSMDGVTFVDSGQVLPAVTGSAINFPVEYSGAFSYCRLELSSVSGSGTVSVDSVAKGQA